MSDAGSQDGEPSWQRHSSSYGFGAAHGRPQASSYGYAAGMKHAAGRTALPDWAADVSLSFGQEPTLPVADMRSHGAGARLERHLLRPDDDDVTLSTESGTGVPSALAGEDSYIPGVGRGLRSAASASRDARVLDIVGDLHPSPAVAARHQRLSRPTPEASSSGSSSSESESDDELDALGSYPGTASTGNHRGLRATPLGQSRRAVAHVRPALGETKLAAFRAAERPARPQQQKPVQAQAPQRFSRGTSAAPQTSPSPASRPVRAGSAATASTFGDAAAQLRGAMRAAEAAENDDSSGETLLGSAQGPDGVQANLQHKGAEAAHDDPWMVLPSGRRIGPSAFRARLPDLSGVTSALGSPVRTRKAEAHVPLAKLKEPPHELEALSGYVKGWQRELGATQAQFEVHRGEWQQQVGALQAELDDLKRRPPAVAVASPGPVAAAREFQRQEREKRYTAAADAQGFAEPIRASSPLVPSSARARDGSRDNVETAPSSQQQRESDAKMQALHDHVRQLDAELAKYREDAERIRAATPAAAAHATGRRAEEPIRVPRASRAQAVQAGGGSSPSDMDADALRAHVARVEHEVVQLRRFVDNVPADARRFAASSPAPVLPRKHRTRSRSDAGDAEHSSSDGDLGAAGLASLVQSRPVSRSSRRAANVAAQLHGVEVWSEGIREEAQRSITPPRNSTPPLPHSRANSRAAAVQDEAEGDEQDPDETARPRDHQPRAGSSSSRRQAPTTTRARHLSSSSARFIPAAAGQVSDDERSQAAADETVDDLDADVTIAHERAERTFEVVAARGEAARQRADGQRQLEHDERSCTVCKARSKTESRKAARKERVRAGSRIDGGAEGAEDEVLLLSFLEASEEATALGQSAPLLGSRQLKVLQRLVQEHMDEFVHARMLYAELADELKGIDPSMSATRRRILAEHVLEAVEQLEFKASRINALQLLLPPSAPTETEHRSSAAKTPKTSSAAKKSSRAARNSPPTMDVQVDRPSQRSGFGSRRTFHD